MRKVLLLFFLFLFLFPTWLPDPGSPPVMMRNVVMITASWYGSDFEGRLMANGKPFKAHDPTTAAHPTLKFGTKVYLENPTNGRTLVVVVKDRGPFTKGRDLDLSRAAAKKLGYVKEGVTKLVMVALK